MIVEGVSVVLNHIRTHLLFRNPDIRTGSTSNDSRCLPFKSLVGLLILAASGRTVDYGMIIQTEGPIGEHYLLWLLLLVPAFSGLQLSEAAVATLRVES